MHVEALQGGSCTHTYLEVSREGGVDTVRSDKEREDTTVWKLCDDGVATFGERPDGVATGGQVVFEACARVVRETTTDDVTKLG